MKANFGTANLELRPDDIMLTKAHPSMMRLAMKPSGIDTSEQTLCQNCLCG